MPHLKLSFALILLLNPLSGHSQNCQKSVLEASHKRAEKGRLSVKMSVEELKTLLKDFKAIDKKMKNDSESRNFLRNCRQKKEEIFYTFVQTINRSAFESSYYNSTMGDYFFYKKNYSKALEHFDLAAKQQKNNFFDLQKAWRAYYLSWKVDFSKMEEVFEALPSKIEFVKVALRRLDELINHDFADSQSKVSFLIARAFIYKNEKMTQKERADWRKIVEIDETHYIALRELSLGLYKLNLFQEAQPYLKKLTQLKDSKIKHHILHLKTLYQLDLKSKLLKESKKSATKFPSNLNFRAFQARALFMQLRLDEAESLNNQILSKEPKNILALENLAWIYEKNADAWLAQKVKFPHALAAYNKALELFPRKSLKEKMAKVLFSYRKGLNFEPAEATKVDLNQALDLLEEQVNEDHVSEQTLSLYIRASFPAQEYKKGERACLKYSQTFQNAFSRETIENCVRIFQETKNFTALQEIQPSSPVKRIPSSYPPN